MTTIVSIADDNGEEIVFFIEDEKLISNEDFRPKGSERNLESIRVEEKLSTYFDPIRRLANSLAKKITEIELKPSDIEVSLGVKITSKAGLVFVNAGADAEMKVTLKWKP